MYAEDRTIFKDAAMNDFSDFLLTTSLFDFPFVGCQFSWSNKRVDGFQMRKLDRALVNEAWLNCFPSTLVEFLPPGISDHSPVFLSLGKKVDAGRKPFKFFNFWTKHSDYATLIHQTWSMTVSGNPMTALYGKLRLVKRALKDFRLKVFGDVHNKVCLLRAEIEALQTSVLSSPSNVSDRHRLQELQLQYSEALRTEEAQLRQHSRIQWIREGDQNSGFFFRSVQAKMARDSISVLYSVDGRRFDSVEDIKKEEWTILLIFWARSTQESALPTLLSCELSWESNFLVSRLLLLLLMLQMLKSKQPFLTWMETRVQDLMDLHCTFSKMFGLLFRVIS